MRALRRLTVALAVVSCLLAGAILNPEAPAPCVVAAEQERPESGKQRSSGNPAQDGENGGPPSPRDTPLPPVPAPTTNLSEAGQIAGLQRTIEADEAHLRDLQGKLEDHEEEFENASAQFRKAEDALEDHRRKLEELVQAGKEREAAELEASTAQLETQRDLAGQRLEAAVQLRKTTQQQIATLREFGQGCRKRKPASSGPGRD